jgi:hypothetical protein
MILHPYRCMGRRAGELIALDLQAIFQALKFLLCTHVSIAMMSLTPS